METFDDLLDTMLMSQLGAQGNTLAHMFLQDMRKPDMNNLQMSFWRRGQVRIFIPPKDEDRVVMFEDNSGLYIHNSGLCTPMGADISHEIHQWEETR
jgi:hypothetical protein